MSRLGIFVQANIFLSSLVEIQESWRISTQQLDKQQTGNNFEIFYFGFALIYMLIYINILGWLYFLENENYNENAN